MVVPSYTNLYAVPKDSFDQYLRHKAGALGNVKNIKVNQLNINEADEINPYHAGGVAPTGSSRGKKKRIEAPDLNDYSYITSDKSGQPNISRINSINNSTTGATSRANNSTSGATVENNGSVSKDKSHGVTAHDFSTNGSTIAQVNIDASQEQQAAAERIGTQIPAELEHATLRGKAFQYLSPPVRTIQVPPTMNNSFTPQRLLESPSYQAAVQKQMTPVNVVQPPPPEDYVMQEPPAAAAAAAEDYVMQELPEYQPVPNLGAVSEASFSNGISNQHSSTPIRNKIPPPKVASTGPKQITTPQKNSLFQQPFPPRSPRVPSSNTRKKKIAPHQELRKRLAAKRASGLNWSRDKTPTPAKAAAAAAAASKKLPKKSPTLERPAGLDTIAKNNDHQLRSAEDQVTRRLQLLSMRMQPDGGSYIASPYMESPPRRIVKAHRRAPQAEAMEVENDAPPVLNPGFDLPLPTPPALKKKKGGNNIAKVTPKRRGRPPKVKPPELKRKK